MLGVWNSKVRNLYSTPEKKMNKIEMNFQPSNAACSNVLPMLTRFDVDVLFSSSLAFNERILLLHTQLLSFYSEITSFIRIIIARECHMHRRYGNIFAVLDSRLNTLCMAFLFCL